MLFSQLSLPVELFFYAIALYFVIRYFFSVWSEGKQDQYDLEKLIAQKQVQLRQNFDQTSTQIQAPAQGPFWLDELIHHNDLHKDFYEYLKKQLSWDHHELPRQLSQKSLEIFQLQDHQGLKKIPWEPAMELVIQDHMIEYHQWDHQYFLTAVFFEALLLEYQARNDRGGELKAIDLYWLSVLIALKIDIALQLNAQDRIQLAQQDLSMLYQQKMKFYQNKDYLSVMEKLMERVPDFMPLVQAPQLALHDQQSLKEQFHQLSRRYHPDRFPLNLFSDSTVAIISSYLNQQYAKLNQDYRKLDC